MLGRLSGLSIRGAFLSREVGTRAVTKKLLNLGRMVETSTSTEYGVLGSSVYGSRYFSTIYISIAVPSFTMLHAYSLSLRK